MAIPAVIYFAQPFRAVSLIVGPTVACCSECAVQAAAGRRVCGVTGAGARCWHAPCRRSSARPPQLEQWDGTTEPFPSAVRSLLLSAVRASLHCSFAPHLRFARSCSNPSSRLCASPPPPFDSLPVAMSELLVAVVGSRGLIEERVPAYAELLAENG